MNKTLVSRTRRIAKRCGAEPGPIAPSIAGPNGPRFSSASLRAALRPGHEREHYLTTPDVNPAFRRGGLISFFRKQRASRPV